MVLPLRDFGVGLGGGLPPQHYRHDFLSGTNFSFSASTVGAQRHMHQRFVPRPWPAYAPPRRHLPDLKQSSSPSHPARRRLMPAKVLIAFYSRNGSLETPANAVADGSRTAGSRDASAPRPRGCRPGVMTKAQGWAENAARMNQAHEAPTEADAEAATGRPCSPSTTRWGILASSLYPSAMPTRCYSGRERRRMHPASLARTMRSPRRTTSNWPASGVSRHPGRKRAHGRPHRGNQSLNGEAAGAACRQLPHAGDSLVRYRTPAALLACVQQFNSRYANNAEQSAQQTRIYHIS